jgi:hypothetical protein
MTRRATQTERVLAALRTAGTRGITRDDFEAPRGRPVIDGGPLIKRLAPRIRELKDAGYTITNGPTRDGCATYVLVGVPTPPAELLCRWEVSDGGSLWVHRFCCWHCTRDQTQLLGLFCCGRPTRPTVHGPWVLADIPAFLNPPSTISRVAA